MGCLCVVTTVCRKRPPIDPSFRGILPIEWVHVPKCGTSFINTLIHIPFFCPAISKDLVYQPPMGSFVSNHLVGKCDTSLLDIDLDRIRHKSIEVSLSGGFEAAKGRFMMFVRQPEQRLLSHYHYRKGTGKHSSLKYMMTYESGVMTKMLAGRTNKTLGREPPNRTEV